MFKNSNYQTLLAISHDIEHQSKTSPAFALFNADKIRRFYQQNAIRLKIANEKLKAMFDDHVNKDKDGKYMTIKHKKGTETWDFIDEKNEKMFQEKHDSLMSVRFDINF